MNLVETIRKSIDAHGLIPAGSEVVVAVSGGADSVALLHAFHALGIPCSVAHLNHQLRGDQSDADEAFVRQLAKETGCRLIVKSVDVRAMAESSVLSIEMAARRARHDFFAEFGDATIALAHHADDQVETFILKLARGAGTEGLGGMPRVQNIGSLRLIRPMLDLSHADIVEWLSANGYAWREDASNSDEAYLRNRVRHSILPRLEKELNPNIRKTILRTMDILREENEWMEETVKNQPMDKPLPLAAKRRLLRNWLFANGAQTVDFDAVEGILALMDKGNGTTIYELNDRQRVVVEYGKPRFEVLDAAMLDPSWTLTVEPGTGWRKDRSPTIGHLPAEASFNADRIGESPVEVRGVRPGDRMEPLGMAGSRKLQDILTDLKVPRDQRRTIPVVVCRDEIIWLPGYRIARGWEVRGDAGKSVHIRIEQSHAS